VRRPLAAGGVLALGLCVLFCHRRAEPPSAHLVELRQLHARLHERLDRLLLRESVVQQARSQKGDVCVAIRAGLLKELIQAVVRRYLDRVVIDLNREIKVNEKGGFKAKTFLGEIDAGTWRVDLTIHGIRGVLRGRAPSVALGEANRVKLSVPVLLEGGHGAATVHFSWEAKGAAKLICRNFELTREFDGLVLPDRYVVSGAFLLRAAPDSITTQPEFVDTAYRLHFDLPAHGWEEARAALATQEGLLKCGIRLNPSEAVLDLQRLLREGFDVKLPQVLFRAVTLPATLRQSVKVEDKVLELHATASSLQVTPDALWYSAGVHTVSHEGASAPRP